MLRQPSSKPSEFLIVSQVSLNLIAKATGSAAESWKRVSTYCRSQVGICRCFTQIRTCVRTKFGAAF